MILPKEDKYYGTRETMREQIIHLLGGRVAEMLTLDDISTGASNDIMRATEIAKDMVTKYGFSEKLGPVNYSSSDEVFLGKDFSTRKNYSEETASEIDEEVKAIIEEAYDAAKKILSEHMEQLTNVAEGLLAVETLDNTQFEQLYDGEITPQQLADQLKEELEKKRQKDEAEAAEAAKELRRRQEREKEKFLQEMAETVMSPEAEKGNSKFGPRLMTYNDVTNEAKPYSSDAKDTEADMPADDRDDDIPSEEELAVYDTDYLSANDEDEADVSSDPAEDGDGESGERRK